MYVLKAIRYLAGNLKAEIIKADSTRLSVVRNGSAQTYSILLLINHHFTALGHLRKVRLISQSSVVVLKFTAQWLSSESEFND